MTAQQALEIGIDNVLCVGMSFPDFLVALRRAGCEVKIGKQPSIKPPGSKKYFRLDTLHEDYSEDAIKERLAGRHEIVPRKKSDDDSERKAAEYMEAMNNQNSPSLLFDIQSKIAAEAGEGYVPCCVYFINGGGDFQQKAPIDKSRQNDYNNVMVFTFAYHALEAQFYEWIYKREGSSGTMGCYGTSSSENVCGGHDSRRNKIFKYMGNPRRCS